MLLSQLLALPAPKHQQLYYATVLINLSKLVTAFPPADSPPAAKDSQPLVLPGGRKLPPVV